jgi:hypothetical protein
MWAAFSHPNHFNGYANGYADLFRLMVVLLSLLLSLFPSFPAFPFGAGKGERGKVAALG